MTIDLSQTGGEAGREDTQWFTQDLAATALTLAQGFTDRSWLDVGAGLARSKQRIERHKFTVSTQDTAPGLPVDYTDTIAALSARKRFDVVSAFDVIEHIPTMDMLKAFLYDLRRLARAYALHDGFVQRVNQASQMEQHGAFAGLLIYKC